MRGLRRDYADGQDYAAYFECGERSISAGTAGRGPILMDIGI
jgi:hypothetical protein